MVYYALVFMLIGLTVAALNLAGVATVAVQISWILFLIGMGLAAIVLVSKHPAPPVT